MKGEVVQLYGRKVGEHLRAGTPLHLYLPGPRRGVFNAQGLAAAGELIVCESLIDALTFYSHGLRHVTATFGADGYTEELHGAITDAGVERVLIAFDRDDAGDRGAEALAKRLGGCGIECFRVLFPAGQDANSFALGANDAPGALAELLRAAVWIGAGTPPARTAAVRKPPADPPAPERPQTPGGEEEMSDAGPRACLPARSSSQPPSRHSRPNRRRPRQCRRRPRNRWSSSTAMSCAWRSRGAAGASAVSARRRAMSSCA